MLNRQGRLSYKVTSVKSIKKVFIFIIVLLLSSPANYWYCWKRQEELIKTFEVAYQEMLDAFLKGYNHEL